MVIIEQSHFCAKHINAGKYFLCKISIIRSGNNTFLQEKFIKETNMLIRRTLSSSFQIFGFSAARMILERRRGVQLFSYENWLTHLLTYSMEQNPS